MENFTYSDPVAKLLTLGRSRDQGFAWPDYPQMGFTHEHIAELIRLMQDDDLANQPWDKDDNESPVVYGQMHAWRILTELQAIEAIPAMIKLLRTLEDSMDDYISTEIPRALGTLGEAALVPSYELLLDHSSGVSPRIHAATAIEEIGKKHPRLRRACVYMLINALTEYQSNDEGVNSFVIMALAGLKSQEAALLVEKVIRDGHSDSGFSGNYHAYKVRIGLLN
jgi:HEAT repeat protein